MCEYPAVDSDARGRRSGVRVARDLRGRVACTYDARRRCGGSRAIEPTC